jgi:hypothetical protein
MTTNHTPRSTPARRRRITASATLLIASGAIALGAMTAPVANAAISESTIKSECAQANGTYSSTGVAPDGHTYSACCYKDYKGQKWCDSYTDGGYTVTLPGLVKKAPPQLGTRGNTPVTAPPVQNAPVTALQ